jgi:hypothetical protein
MIANADPASDWEERSTALRPGPSTRRKEQPRKVDLAHARPMTR